MKEKDVIQGVLKDVIQEKDVRQEKDVTEGHLALTLSL